ncbi:hypothetical protein CLV47_101144 [Antricoccus suffuscus]|uniref:Uncharacterized protein n=1 Tax=Antricoccus suffuscus TaxID=1629062 RepID=A0A2T1A600_9ACTN|nr:hypothetical protein [Antricoccus suffuscus]PRZ44020.1 hypothetical protein CLV47_101144 [Antricoccus suffuscus]
MTQRLVRRVTSTFYCPGPYRSEAMRRHPFLSGISALIVAWLIACYFFFIDPAVDQPEHAGAVVVLGGSPERLPVGQNFVAQGVSLTLVVSDSPARKMRARTRNARPRAVHR